MIALTRSGREKEQIYLNHHLIKLIKMNKDTLIELTTGTTMIVTETPEEIIDRIISFESKVSYTAEKRLEQER